MHQHIQVKLPGEGSCKSKADGCCRPYDSAEFLRGANLVVSLILAVPQADKLRLLLSCMPGDFVQLLLCAAELLCKGTFPAFERRAGSFTQLLCLQPRHGTGFRQTIAC